MKKYISIPDFRDESINHYFEVPSAFFVHAKVCSDGVAIVIGDAVNDTMYGYTVPAEAELLPVLTYLLAHQETKDIESYIAALLTSELNEFIGDEDSHVFVMQRYGDILCDELNYALEASLLPEMFGEDKPRRKKSQKNKKSSKNNPTNHNNNRNTNRK